MQSDDIFLPMIATVTLRRLPT